MTTSSTSRLASAAMLTLCLALAALTLGTLVGIAGYLAIAGAASLRAALPDMIAPLHGTLTLIALAAIVSVPVGILAGLCIAEFQHDQPLGRLFRRATVILTGIPGITLCVAAYWLAVAPARAKSNLAAAAALTLVIAPAIARTTARILHRVRRDHRAAAAALGASPTATIFRVLLPATAASLAAGIALVLAAAAGEAAPLLFTASQPTLPVQAYASASGAAPPALALAAVFVLCAAVFALNLAAHLAHHRARAPDQR